MRIGLDLDNTLIFYDDAFVAGARMRGLVPADFSGTKQQVRDHIRTLPDGERSWQKLQGYVYGKGIGDASLFPGVQDFVAHARKAGHTLYIVSHKTLHGHFDEDKVNLRDAAIGLLMREGLVGERMIPRAHIFFESTREEKVAHIAQLGLDWFVDDLIEVYEEPHFPPATRRVLFHTHPAPAPEGNWHTHASWQQISGLLLA